MSNEKDVTKRILEAKIRQPEHLRLDIEPKVGGQSLLHDEFGMPKTGGGQRRNIPPMKEISNEPVVVKASKSGKIKTRGTITIKEDGNYIKVPDFTGSNIEEDDKFIPPKSNFVSVGNMEHAWYDEKVTGPSMVDNNDEVDVDSLQGINPLVEKENSKIGEAVEFFTKKLQYIKTLVITELSEITDAEEIKNLRQNTFGENGIFTEVVKKIMSLNTNKHSLTTLIDYMYSEIDLEIQGKEFELQSEVVDDETEEWPEDMAQIPLADEELADKEITDNEDKAAIQEGEFAIIVHNDIVDIVKDIESARDLISKIVLNDNVDLSAIQLVKRIKIDFGIILGD
jgi:hypothetical protein